MGIHHEGEDARVTLSERQCEFTEKQALLVLFAVKLGYRVKGQEWNRTLAQQESYVRQGVSKTLNSRHIDKLAVDLVLFKNGNAITSGEDFRALGEYWESLGGRWGGRFVDLAAFRAEHGREFDPAKDLGWDCCHFELTWPA